MFSQKDESMLDAILSLVAIIGVVAWIAVIGGAAIFTGWNGVLVPVFHAPKIGLDQAAVSAILIALYRELLHGTSA